MNKILNQIICFFFGHKFYFYKYHITGYYTTKCGNKIPHRFWHRGTKIHGFWHREITDHCTRCGVKMDPLIKEAIKYGFATT